MERLGISLYPGTYGQGGVSHLRYRDAMTLGREAEQCGFDGVFVVEAGMLLNDAMATAQAIALNTSRITVATGIAHADFRHAEMLGIHAVAIDELSEGRFVLGIGTSSREMSKVLGLTWQEPRAFLRETTAVLRRIFEGAERPAPLGPYWAARHGVPLHFAALSLESAELAGEIADGLMLYLATADRYHRVRERLERGAARAGRAASEIEITQLIPVFLDDDIDSARDVARTFLGFALALPMYQKLFRRSGFEREMEAVAGILAAGAPERVGTCLSDELVDAVCLVGPAARCRERLGAMREGGVTYPVLAPQPVSADSLTAARALLAAFARR